MRSTLLLLSALFLPLTGAWAGAKPDIAVPTSKWTVDFADSKCIARHAFAVSKHAWIVAINPTPASDQTLIRIVAPRGAPSLLSARFYTGGVELKEAGMAFKGVDLKGRAYVEKGLYSIEYARLLEGGSLRSRLAGWT